MSIPYSFSRLLKHVFDCFVLFFNTPHTISTTTHPMCKTPKIHCKMKHSCKNFTLIQLNHILLSYETHTLHMTEFCLYHLHTAVINLKHFTISSPNTTQDQCCRLMKILFNYLHIHKSVNMSTWRITTKHVPVFMLLQ